MNLNKNLPKESGIYCYVNNINNKKYVGLSNNIFKRVGEHETNFKKDIFNEIKKSENVYLWNSVKKYGRENFSVYVVELCDKEILGEKEIYYIKELKSHISQNGYNILWGGNLGWLNIKLSDETKLKLSKLFSDGRRKGDKNANFGNKGILSPLFGKPLEEETKRKISESHKGKPRSEETKEKLRQVKGNKHWAFGKKLNDEEKDKLSKQLIGIKKKGSSSEYKGVSYYKNINRYKASITINRVYTYIGVFKLEIDAAKAYDEKCWEVYQDLSMLNFPENYK